MTFESFISLIQSHEGYRATEYNDIFKNPTIGYGHVIKKGEHFTSLTRYEALELLKKDYRKSIQLVKSVHKDTLSRNQELALGHFVYAKGIGNYVESELRNAIAMGDSLKIYKEWVEWAIVDGRYNIKSLHSRNVEYFTFMHNINEH